ncbi:hypothetical protein K469DRAFT_568615 [Zopfia rhizophila CBS 207.26]|uniref:Uncharacterized protein n=1 Tax=Zopfia rhizophila CBS 207.26 TaxID=1314779 RepID=A0A6A6EBC9_9PEZI|nr:hypothetical protein K469DRAFT_568615 [Zopfia rhizophila CBS 207.26]
MDEQRVKALMSTVELISTTLDAVPNSWRDQLQAIRNTTASLEFLDTTPDETRKAWQIPLISVFQRIAFVDADNGGVPDVANWCLRQALTLLQVYPDNLDLLTMIGKNWLLRAQKSLAIIHNAERGSSSSGAGSERPLSKSEEERQAARAAAKAEDQVHTADYVEARGILLPATEYLKRAVDVARAQGMLTGTLLSTAAEAFMSLGNVSSIRVNEQYFHEALAYLRAAGEIPGYGLPAHLQQ